MNKTEEKEAIVRAGEDQRVQEAQWIEEELERQRRYEDEVRVLLQEEQRLLDEKKRSINENMERTLQLKRYNNEKEAAIESQAYGLYGITGDKLEGLDRYKDAIFKGTAGGFLVLTLGLAILSGFLNGFDHSVTLYLICLMAAEGALLPKTSKEKGLYRIICNVMYFTLLPAAVFIFMSYELNFTEYDFIKKYIAVAASVFAAFGVIGYFSFNPYKKDRKYIRLAKKDLKVLKIDAAKNVKKNEKDRIKQEEEQRKIDAKEAAKLEKQQAELLEKQRKEEEAEKKQAKKEAEAAKRKAKKEAEAALKKEKSEENASKIRLKKAEKSVKIDADSFDEEVAVDTKKEDIETSESEKKEDEVMGPHAI